MASESQRATYVQAVQALYLELRGGGLTLSPVDTDRIRAWWQAGIPLELALQGLRAAHASFAAGGNRMRPFTLRSAERHVAELGEKHERLGGAIRQGTDGSPGPAPTPAVEAAADPRTRWTERIRARVAGSAPRVRAAWEAALSHLGGAPADAPFDVLLSGADTAQAIGYLQALERPLQRTLAQQARETAGPRSGMPRTSYRAMLRACLGDVARAHGQFLRPSDLA